MPPVPNIQIVLRLVLDTTKKQCVTVFTDTEDTEENASKVKKSLTYCNIKNSCNSEKKNDCHMNLMLKS